MKRLLFLCMILVTVPLWAQNYNLQITGAQADTATIRALRALSAGMTTTRLDSTVARAERWMTGTGIQAPIVDKGGQAHNVVAYGADRTGVADSWAAIDAALAASRLANKGHVVYFPSGTYTVSAPIDIHGGDQIIGDGVTSIIQPSGATNSLLRNYDLAADSTMQSQISIKNLYFYANGKVVPYGINFTNCQYSVIDQVEVDGFSEAGIFMLVEKFSAGYNTVSNIISKNNRDGIYVGGNGNTNKFYNIVCTSNSRNGLRVDDNAVVPGSNTTMTVGVFGGTMESNKKSGMYLNGRGILISGVHFEGNGEDSAATYAIEAASTSYANNLVVGCFFYGNGQGTHNCQISGIDTSSGTGAVVMAWGVGHGTMGWMSSSEFHMAAGGLPIYMGAARMYESSGNLYLQGSGSGKTINMNNVGGYGATLNVNNVTSKWTSTASVSPALIDSFKVVSDTLKFYVGGVGYKAVKE